MTGSRGIVDTLPAFAAELGLTRDVLRRMVSEAGVQPVGGTAKRPVYALRDIYRALRTVKELRAGIVWVNHMQPTYVEAPWGGYKQSGIGRELGKWGVEEYLHVKQVHINLNEQPIGWY